ncbi:MAG: DUF433 domain-containing protein [Chloroflexi bacterium]|nr:DUF433 domain-containing protein [Chloroflexota bacterium]MYE41134.1 DUF433 domain-containing protein [Chloroflexota bacterium]
MTQTKVQSDWRRPLETPLDFSPMPVPLRWAEGGLVVRLNNSRIALDIIVSRYRRGYTPEMIVDNYPWLELSDIYLIIAFYLRNKESVRDYLRESYQQADQGWAQSFAEGYTSEESYQAYLESRADDWFDKDC